MGSIDKALPHAGFYPDSQNLRSDGAKIRSIFESSKYFGTFFVFSYLSLYFSETFCTFASSIPVQIGAVATSGVQ